MNKGILWIKLDKESKENLINIVRPNYPKIYCDHITLLYGVYLDNYKEFIGRNEEIIVLENNWNNFIQAVTVEIKEELPRDGISPHITISSIIGVSPVKSNNMLFGIHNNEILSQRLKLNGKIEFYEFNPK